MGQYKHGTGQTLDKRQTWDKTYIGQDKNWIKQTLDRKRNITNKHGRGKT